MRNLEIACLIALIIYIVSPVDFLIGPVDDIIVSMVYYYCKKKMEGNL